MFPTTTRLTSRFAVIAMITFAKAMTALIVLNFAGADAARGANVILREQAVAHGPVLRLGDIADIHANDARELQSLMATPLGPTPQRQQFLRAAEVRDLLASRGMDMRTIRFAGAAAVQIGASQTTVTRPNQPAPTSQQTLNDNQRNQLAAEVERLLREYLTQQTGRPLWSIELTAGAAKWSELYGVGTNWKVSGGKAPWTGRQRFLLHRAGNQDGVAVAAIVRRKEMVLYAAAPIEAGQLIRRADIELQARVGGVPAAVIRSVEAAIGKEARRSIPAGTMMNTTSLRSPVLVTRGETVTVYARAAGVTVRTLATAKQEGSLGDLIQVETPDRLRYAARVVGQRELEVYAANNNADDLPLRRTQSQPESRVLATAPR